jgi:hypothetical protein
MYPVSSRNDKDFMNLVDIYMDAVLHPLAVSKPEIFYQEGWHYELHDKGDRKVTLGDYVEIIKTVAEYYSLPVCDLWAISGLQPNVPIIREKYIPDGLHPNDAGHEIIAERIANFLLAL